MSAPESLDQARRDGWDDDEDFFDESEGLPVDDERDCVFQVGAEGQYRPPGRQHSHRAGRVTASASQHGGSESPGADDRVIHSPRDGALADQERVGDAGKPVERFEVVHRDGFA